MRNLNKEGFTYSIASMMQKMFDNPRLKEVNGLIREVQDFALESLEIYYPKPLSITTVKEHVLYDLYAAPKLKLFYDYSEIEKYSNPNKRKVKKVARGYKKKGYDTLVTNLQAYESEGIFLTKKILKDTNVEIVSSTIHELVHSQLNLDISIEESIATIIDSLGTISFYEQKEGKHSQNYERAVIDDALLRSNDTLIIQYYNLLYDAYEQEILDSKKLKIKKELCKEADSKVTYSHKMNNASLTYYMTYARYTNEVREVCKHSDSLKDAINLFKILPDDKSLAYTRLQEFISAHKKNNNI